MVPDMGRLYDRAAAYGQKWESLWCRQLAVALVALLDPQREKDGDGPGKEGVAGRKEEWNADNEAAQEEMYGEAA